MRGIWLGLLLVLFPLSARAQDATDAGVSRRDAGARPVEAGPPPAPPAPRPAERPANDPSRRVEDPARVPDRSTEAERPVRREGQGIAVTPDADDGGEVDDVDDESAGEGADDLDDEVDDDLGGEVPEAPHWTDERAGAWATFIASFLVGAGGGIILAVGVDDVNTVENAASGASWARVADAYERAPILTGVGAAVLAVGAAGTLVGAILLGVYGGGGTWIQVSALPGGLRLSGTF